MVISTRTSDGTIGRVQYGYASLRLKGEAESLNFQSNKFLRALNTSIPQPSREDITQGINFIPPTAFGEIAATGQSAIEHAKRNVTQWEIVRKAHKKHLPRLLPQIDGRIREAREALQQLLDNKDDLEANSTPINQIKRKQKVLDRIVVLQDALRNSKFGPETENIQAAIDGYRTGKIIYSSKYTLIWFGKIVDQVNTYADFTVDRTARLDRYLEQYGPHWLWWESPLQIHPNSAPRLSASASLIRDVAPHGLGQYYISQSFWKRAGWVRRMPGNAEIPIPLSNELESNFLTSPDGRVYCQSEGPKLVFNSLLDSGATYPSLNVEDFVRLGIEPDNYAAQSIETVMTANGLIHALVFEMFVTVVDQATMRSLVDENDAVWPYHGKYLGGLCPVLMNVAANNAEPDEQGFITNSRLSGLLPFLACYVTSTPTRNRLFFGEDRNDVMGGHRTPGHRRWDISMPSTQTAGQNNWNGYDNPIITFSHRAGDLVNQDRIDIRHASTTGFLPGRPGAVYIEHNPKADCDADRARRQAEQFEAAPPPFNQI